MFYTDNWISTWVLDNITSQNEFIARIAKFLSEINSFGQMWLLLAAAITVIYSIRKKKVSLYLIIAIIPVCLIWALSEYGLKEWVGRLRPYQEIEGFTAIYDLINYKYPSGASFPSNHTLVSFAAAFIVFKFDKKLAPYAYVLAILIALSRLVLGAHYASDIIAGMGLGTLAGVIASLIADKLAPKVDDFINLKIENRKKKNATR